MKKMISLVALCAALGVGCKKKRAEEGTMSGSAMGSGGAMGSAAAGSGSAMGSGSAGSAETKPMTAEDMAKRFDECWGFFNEAKWDDFKGCWASDAVAEEPGSGMPEATGPDAIVTQAKAFKTAFPDMKGEAQLELVSGHTVVAVMFMSGTNSGPMQSPAGEMPATNEKVGYMMGQVVELDDTGKAKHDWEFFDLATVMGQLNPQKDHPVRPVIEKLEMPKVVVIAKDDDAEKANLEADKKMYEAFNKHDIKALGDTLADDSTWSEAASPKDLDKKQNLEQTQKLWKAFSDVKLTPTTQWAAGDYVATVGTFEGTNDGDMPEHKMKKTGKKVSLPFFQVDKIEGGKVKATWGFYQSMGFMQQLGMMPPAGAGGGAGGSAAGSGAGSAK